MAPHPPSLQTSSTITVAIDSASRASSFTLRKPAPRSRFFTLFLAHLGAALALFLATTDATIVSTSLPTVVADLNASQHHYSWVGVSYMLTQTACQPLYPLFSFLVGRKAVLFSSILIFILGSALCGAAKSILWLIASRGVQGIGAGGIVNSVWVLTSDIVMPEEKNKWSQALSATWSASAIAGPLLGGVFSQGSSVLTWRWAFYMNIPIGLLAICLMHWSLRYFEFERTLNEFSLPELRNEFVHNFDYIGVALLVSGTACTVLGFSLAAQQGWGAPKAITLLTVGLSLLVMGVVYETRTTRVAILPSVLFKSRTEVAILSVSFFHNVAFNAGTFYLALYFQAVLGVSPLLCGVLMLPYSLGGALASVPVALFNDHFTRKRRSTSSYKLVIIGGLALSTLGFGLLTLLDERTGVVLRGLYPLFAGVGLGMLFHSPFAALTNRMSSDERSRTTSAFFLVRFIGATSGLSVAGAIFDSQISRTMPREVFLAMADTSTINWRKLVHIQPARLRTVALQAVTNSLASIWLMCVGCLGLACLISFCIRVVEIEQGALDEDPSVKKSEIGGV